MHERGKYVDRPCVPVTQETKDYAEKLAAEKDWSVAHTLAFLLERGLKDLDRSIRRK
jgi:hypothetical protein